MRLILIRSLALAARWAGASTRRVIAGLLLALALVLAYPLWTACAQEPDHHEQGHHEHEQPIEVYYNQSFFNEPWRLPGEDRRVLGEAAAVGGAALGVLVALALRRRSS